jgi:hypothetical protein
MGHRVVKGARQAGDTASGWGFALSGDKVGHVGGVIGQQLLYPAGAYSGLIGWGKQAKTRL